MATVEASRIAHQEKSDDERERARVLELANTNEAKRERAKLAAAYRILARRGLDDGIAGHLSLRVPGAPDYFWVNPFGRFFSEVTAENLVLINHQGQIVDGGPIINFAAFCIHAAIHAARPEVNCACHTHPPAGSAYSALSIPLEPLDQTGCSFFEDHGIYREYDGIVLTSGQARGIIESIGNKRALILVNHGLLTCAGTVEQALIDMLDLERTCAVNLRAMSAHRPVHPVPDEAARQARAVLTRPERFPFVFAALVRELSREETDWDPHGWINLW